MSSVDFLETLLDGAEVEWKPLGEVADYSNTRIGADLVDQANYIGVDNLLQNRAGKEDSSYVPTEGRLIEYRVGDVLIGNIRPYLKKIWHADCDGGTNGDVLVIQSKHESLHPRYLYQVLTDDQFFEYNMQHAKGAKMPRGDKAKIMEYLVPIPCPDNPKKSLEIQAEIVRILDTFTELTTRKKQYNHYRDQLLSFEDGNVEWKTLGGIGDFTYGYVAKAQDSGGTRFVRITDISTDGKLIAADSKYVDLSEDNERFLLKKNDLLMARTGATYGKTMIFEEDYPAIYAGFLIKLSLDERIVNPKFYWHFAQSDFFWNQANKLVSGGGQPQFNANVLKEVKMPIPYPSDPEKSLTEQKRIVAILDKFDALTNSITEGLPREIELRQKQYAHYRDLLLSFPKPQEVMA